MGYLARPKEVAIYVVTPEKIKHVLDRYIVI